MKGNPTAEQLATIAVHFIMAGDNQAEALRKANAPYFAACDYLKQFAAMSGDDKAFELDSEKAVGNMVVSRGQT
ncbi:MAG: hypothetical protein ACR2ID_11340 [Chthoniobacterales bacterium]